MSTELLTGLLSGLVGYALGSREAPTEREVIDYLRQNKPEFVKDLSIDTSIARDKEPYPIVGNYIFVENPDAASVSVEIRLNEPEAAAMDLTEQRKIKGPFYQFFISNAAGTGTLNLHIGKAFGFELVEAITHVLVKGDYGGIPKTLAVDVHGYLQALMKGAYNSTLKTIATDSQGRMLAVMTDPEDIWGNPHHLGLAELAARLGSPVTFDRRGNVIWFDDFESGLNKWLTYAVGTGAVVQLSAKRCHRGCCSVRLVAGSDSSRYAGLHWDGAFQNVSKLGYEMCWSGADTDVYGYMTDCLAWSFYIQDGNNAHVGAIIYDVKNALWNYIDENCVAQTFLSGYYHMPKTTLFNFFKLVVDPVNNKYTRVLINNAEYDLSDYALYSYADPTYPSIILTFDINSQPGKLAECFVDNVVLTQNEP